MTINKQGVGPLLRRMILAMVAVIVAAPLLADTVSPSLSPWVGQARNPGDLTYKCSASANIDDAARDLAQQTTALDFTVPEFPEFRYSLRYQHDAGDACTVSNEWFSHSHPPADVICGVGLRGDAIRTRIRSGVCDITFTSKVIRIADGSIYHAGTGTIFGGFRFFQTLSCPEGYRLAGYTSANLICVSSGNYTIRLDGLGGDVMPFATRTAYVQVMDGATPKSGAQVTLTLTVVPELAGQLPVTYTGSLSTYSGITGADGRLSFVFTAPEAGGTHTITASCVNCTNQATGTLRVPGCSVADLPPITDRIVQAFEANPNLSDTANLTPRMQTALSCLQTAVTAAGGTSSVGSAYRPPAYNQHLIDVWDKWDELQDNPELACTALKTRIQEHFQRHGLLETQPPVPGSQHTLGEAVDVTINLPTATIDALATGCQLRRPSPIRDRVHFIHR